MVNPWFSRTISTKKQQSYHCRPLKPHTGSKQPWPLVALKGSKMVNPGLAQVIQHKDICHTIIELCSSQNHLPSKIQPCKTKIQNLNSRLQTPRCNDISKKNSLKLTIVSFGYLWGPYHPWPVVALVGSKMVNPWFSRNISTKKQQSYHCRPLKPHTGSNQPWPLVALKGSKMVNPGLAQVIQHKDTCHTIIELCFSENHLPSKIQPCKTKIQNLNSKLQTPRCNDISKKNSLKLTNYCIFWISLGSLPPMASCSLGGV